MKDRVGQVITVDVTVVFMLPGYRELAIGKVIALTEKRVRVRYRDRAYGGDKFSEYLTHPQDVVVLQGELAQQYTMSILAGEQK